MSDRSFYFDPNGKGAAVFLGPTEARLMELAWRLGEVTVKKTLFHLGDDSQLAYTTVMTVLGRLTDKGILKKQKSGRSYSYRPTTDKKRFIKERVSIIENCLKKNFKKIK